MVSRSWLTLSGLLLTLFVLSTLAICLGCGAASTSQGSPTASISPTTSGVNFSKDVQPIFTAKCAICHQGGAAPGGLGLESGSAYKNLVNVKSTESPLQRVAPGAPDKSYLLNKLLGTQGQVGGSGAQMPFGQPPLSQSQINSIQQWISQGAPDD